MAKITVVEQIDKAKWDKLVLDNGEIFRQLSANADLNVKHGLQAKYILYYDDNKLKGGMLFFQLKNGLLSRIIGMPPVAEKNSRLVIEVIIKEYRKIIKNYAPIFNTVMVEDIKGIGSIFLKNGFTSDARATIVLDTSNSLDEIWQKVERKTARWGVKKAQKLGLKVRAAKSDQDWNKFSDLYLETCKRDNIKPEDFEDIKLTKKYLKGIATLILVEYEGRIIAGSIYSIFRKRMLHMYNASSSKYLYTQPNNLLYWYMVEECKKKNLDELDLGGIASITKKGKTRGVNRFKERWGGKLVRRNVYSSSRLYMSAIKLLSKLGII